MVPTTLHPADATSEKKRSGAAMPATAKTGSSIGTTTVSRVATHRGTPSARATRNTVATPSARPTRAAASM